MGLEVGQLREGFGASWMSALVRLVSGVGSNVLLKVGQLGELSLTNLTSERKIARERSERFENRKAAARMVHVTRLLAINHNLLPGLEKGKHISD